MMGRGRLSDDAAGTGAPSVTSSLSAHAYTVLMEVDMGFAVDPAAVTVVVCHDEGDGLGARARRRPWGPRGASDAGGDGKSEGGGADCEDAQDLRVRDSDGALAGGGCSFSADREDSRCRFIVGACRASCHVYAGRYGGHERTCRSDHCGTLRLRLELFVGAVGYRCWESVVAATVGISLHSVEGLERKVKHVSRI